MYLPVSLLVVSFATQQLVSADDLLFVQALWRHGDRSPISTFPKDQYQEDYWPQGWGQLTATGMMQHFALGTRLRAMYDTNYISTVYKPSEIHVRSTDVDRTYMSAMSNLAGFYQTGTPDLTYPNSNNVPTWPSHWSPIPVHSFGNAQAPHCPRADQLYEAIRASDTYQNIQKQNQPFFDFLTKESGMHISLTSGLGSLYDALLIEKIYNLQMPSWLNDSIWNQMEALDEISDEFYFGIYPPAVVELIKLRGGTLLKAMINEMQLKMFCTQNPTNMTSGCSSQSLRKYSVYSAHDTNIAEILSTLRDEQEVLGSRFPKYASSILFELWNTANGPQVKILYHPEFHMPYYPITNLTEGCPPNSDYCPLNTFVSRSQKYMPVDINAECRRQ